MHYTIKNLKYIEDNIKKEYINLPTIVAVTKNFDQDNIIPLLDYGHQHYGENKVQECVQKWKTLKSKFKNVKLHMIGKLQRNKVKECIKYFDYIHSLDSKKLAKKIHDEQINQNKKLKIFIQINIGKEFQKSGINLLELDELISYTKSLKLDIIGFMCIPPKDYNSALYFEEMIKLKHKYNVSKLSMGMSSDYIEAAKNFSNFLRIGTSIFGKRNS